MEIRVPLNKSALLRVCEWEWGDERGPPSLCHSLPHSLPHSLTRSLARSLTPFLPPSLPPSLTHSLTHSLLPSLPPSITPSHQDYPMNIGHGYLVFLYIVADWVQTGL